jgi:hypothetical protein
VFNTRADSEVTSGSISLGKKLIPFWIIVGAVAFGASSVPMCGSKGLAQRLTVGTQAAQVVETFGEPGDRVLVDPPFVEELSLAECPAKKEIKTAWIYRPAFHDHAMVYFDLKGAVVCVREGGMIFSSVHF